MIEVAHEPSERFVLHFDTPRQSVNAVALAISLQGLSAAIREASEVANPGYVVEVLVERLDDGSFRTSLLAAYKKAQTVFEREAFRAIVYGIIATYIYDVVVQDEPTIIINNDSVVIEYDGKQVVVSKEAYDAKQQIAKSPTFRSSVGQVFAGAKLDPEVKGLRVERDKDPSPPPLIPRAEFAAFNKDGVGEDDRLALVEEASLEISRAILTRGRRKWEFYWRGIRIAAPVLDEQFYDKFFAHEITVAPGDVLRVALRIVRQIDPDTGILMNMRYEVVEVFEHQPRLRQTRLA